MNRAARIRATVVASIASLLASVGVAGWIKTSEQPSAPPSQVQGAEGVNGITRRPTKLLVIRELQGNTSSTGTIDVRAPDPSVPTTRSS